MLDRTVSCWERRERKEGNSWSENQDCLLLTDHCIICVNLHLLPQSFVCQAQPPRCQRTRFTRPRVPTPSVPSRWMHLLTLVLHNEILLLLCNKFCFGYHQKLKVAVNNKKDNFVSYAAPENMQEIMNFSNQGLLSKCCTYVCLCAHVKSVMSRVISGGMYRC